MVCSTLNLVHCRPTPQRESRGGAVGFFGAFWRQSSSKIPSNRSLLRRALQGAEAMGFGFVAAPLMLNVLIILVVAIAFNALFPWRRYPAALVRPASAPKLVVAGREAISHEDFVYALSQMDSFIDISEEDLLRIYGLATGHHRDVLVQEVAAPVSPSGPT